MNEFKEAIARAVALCWAMPKQGELSVGYAVKSWEVVLGRCGATPDEIEEAAVKVLETLNWFPSPAQVVEFVRKVRADRYEAKEKIGVMRADGRLGLVDRNSPEGQAELAKRELTALPEEVAAGETTLKSKLNELAVKFAEPLQKPEKEYAVREMVNDPEGEDVARAMIAAQLAEL